MADAPDTTTEQSYDIEDLSGGMQAATTSFLRKKNEVELAENSDFGTEIGAISKSMGYEERGGALTSTTTTSTSTTTTA